MESNCRFETTSKTSMQFGRDRAHTTPWHEQHYISKYYPPCSTIAERRDRPYADLAFTAFVNALRRIRKTGGIRHDPQKAGCRYRTKLWTLFHEQLIALGKQRAAHDKDVAEFTADKLTAEQATRHTAEGEYFDGLCDKGRVIIASLLSDNYMEFPYYERFDESELTVWRTWAFARMSGAETARICRVSEATVSRYKDSVNETIVEIAVEELRKEANHERAAGSVLPR